MIIDLDGLIIDSLPALADALQASAEEFYQTASQVTEFRLFDLSNPGLSRFVKVDYLVDQLMEPLLLRKDEIKTAILEKFDALSLEARLNSQIDQDIFSILSLSYLYTPVLVTNCEVDQLSVISAHFGLHGLFQDRQFGTPPKKEEAIKRLLSDFGSPHSILLSDSESDAHIARANGMLFAFVSRFARDKGEWLKEGEYSFPCVKDFIDWMGFQGKGLSAARTS